MEFLFTSDPTVIIVYQGLSFVIYYNIETNESWVIYGDCTHNGSCVEGAVNPDLRPYNERLDCPVRPDIECEGCNLKGEYL